MKYQYVLIISGLLICISCKQKEKQANPILNEVAVMDTSGRENTFKKIKFDNKKDFVCGMPISAGVTDTITYKGKLYGFCAKECKEEFLKDPKQYVQAKN
jgi:YHS domain-containing protein